METSSENISRTADTENETETSHENISLAVDTEKDLTRITHVTFLTPLWLRYFLIPVGRFRNFIFQSCIARRETADLQALASVHIFHRWWWHFDTALSTPWALLLRVPYYPFYRHRPWKKCSLLSTQYSHTDVNITHILSITLIF